MEVFELIWQVGIFEMGIFFFLFFGEFEGGEGREGNFNLNEGGFLGFLVKFCLFILFINF